MQNKKKSEAETEASLDEALKETFPGSDAPAKNVTDETPVRPVDRQPPKLDKDLVNRLANETRKSHTKG